MPLYRKLQQAQDDAVGLDFPINLNIEAAGMVVSWMNGTSWRDLCRETSLDQGDIYRIIRRTVEFLRQIPTAYGVPAGIALKAEAAARKMDRFPIADYIENAKTDAAAAGVDGAKRAVADGNGATVTALVSAATESDGGVDAETDAASASADARGQLQEQDEEYTDDDMEAEDEDDDLTALRYLDLAADDDDGDLDMDDAEIDAAIERFLSEGEDSDGMEGEEYWERRERKINSLAARVQSQPGNATGAPTKLFNFLSNYEATMKQGDEARFIDNNAADSAVNDSYESIIDNDGGGDDDDSQKLEQLLQDDDRNGGRNIYGRKRRGFKSNRSNNSSSDGTDTV